MKKQLKEANEQQSKGDNKMQSVTSNLRSLQEEKARIQSTLGQKEAQLNALVSASLSYCSRVSKTGRFGRFSSSYRYFSFR